MQTKASQLKDLMLADQWDKALAMAARFQDLGKHKSDIMLGHEAIVHGSFYKQLGKNPVDLRNAGIAALKTRYAKLLEG